VCDPIAKMAITLTMASALTYHGYMIEVSGSNNSNKMRNMVLIIVGAVLLLGLAGAAGYFYWKYNTISNNPSVATKETTDRLKKAVGKLYDIPKDEEPTIAQVQDKDKLKDQAFFAKAEKNDYILIFTKAKLAILYRETADKLINVGPITISDTSETDNKDKTTPTTNTDKK
jgi:hypothetical protein